MNELDLIKPSPLIYASTEKIKDTIRCPYRLTPVQHRLFNILVDIVHRAKQDETIYEIDFSKLRDLCDDTSEHPMMFFDRVSPIAGMYFVFDGRKTDSKIAYGRYTLISSVDVLKDDSGVPRTFRFIVTPMFKQITDNPPIYAHIDQSIVNNLQSSLAINLYEALIDYDKKEFPDMTISAFKKIIKIEENTYKDIRNFKAHVLNPIRDKVNEHIKNYSYDFRLYKAHGEYRIKWYKLPKIKEICSSAQINSPIMDKPAKLTVKVDKKEKEPIIYKPKEDYDELDAMDEDGLPFI